MNYEQMRDYFRRMKAQQPDMHFNEQPEGSLRESLNAKMRAWANCGVPEVFDESVWVPQTQPPLTVAGVLIGLLEIVVQAALFAAAFTALAWSFASVLKLVLR